MAFDRDGTLKNAEKFVRLGRYDAAIDEYQRVLEGTPDDWKTTNTLADLYLRIGRVDGATALLARIADHLAREGFLPRAEAFYKRILKVSPADEHALERLVDSPRSVAFSSRPRTTRWRWRRRSRAATTGEPLPRRCYGSARSTSATWPRASTLHGPRRQAVMRIWRPSNSGAS